MSDRNFYERLGVPRDASDADIKKAFRELARTKHPDVGGDPEEFKEISEAYNTLSDPGKRKEYDAQLDLGAFGSIPYGGSGDGMGWTDFSGIGDFFRTVGRGSRAGRDVRDVSDMFGDMFGDLGGTGSPSALTVRMSVPFTAAYRGQKMSNVAYEDMSGRPRTINFTLHRGTEDGTRLKFAGRGGTDARGAGHDLVIEIRVEPHPLWHADGRDVRMSVAVSAFEAICGTAVSVPTPDGRHAQIRIPAGTQPGKQFRLAGLGFPESGDKPAGDLIVTVEVVTPDVGPAELARLREMMDGDRTDYRAGAEIMSKQP